MTVTLAERRAAQSTRVDNEGSGRGSRRRGHAGSRPRSRSAVGTGGRQETPARYEPVRGPLALEAAAVGSGHSRAGDGAIPSTARGLRVPTPDPPKLSDLTGIASSHDAVCRVGNLFARKSDEFNNRRVLTETGRWTASPPASRTFVRRPSLSPRARRVPGPHNSCRPERWGTGRRRPVCRPLRRPRTPRIALPSDPSGPRTDPGVLTSYRHQPWLPDGYSA